MQPPDIIFQYISLTLYKKKSVWFWFLSGKIDVIEVIRSSTIKQNIQNSHSLFKKLAKRNRYAETKRANSKLREIDPMLFRINRYNEPQSACKKKTAKSLKKQASITPKCNRNFKL